MSMLETMARRERRGTASIPPSHLSVRKQRIERWAYEGRNESIYAKVMRSTVSTGTSLVQKRAEGSLVQGDRRLKVDLYRLGEQREKSLERHNFDQKLFANKQALRYKENPDIQRTLDYVRRCCKFSPLDSNDGELADSTLVLEENRPPIITPKVKESNVERFLRYAEHQKLPTPLPMPTAKRGTQSAHVLTKSRSLTDERKVQPTRGIRTPNSAPPRALISRRKGPTKTRRPSQRIFATQSTLEEFRRYPERFLSQSNRYLPLLRRQATAMELHEKQQQLQSASRCSDRSEFPFEEANSFLSENYDAGKSTSESPDRRNIAKHRPPSKINLMETAPDKTSEHALALARLRAREYAHLQQLIRSNSMVEILKPFSPIKTLEKKNLKQALDTARNPSNLGLLIF